ncbi:MAG: DUF2219 family protein [Campylobacterota bacterium]|nr:DUF2219 family protein [Campylobacterota bacterium]
MKKLMLRISLLLFNISYLYSDTHLFTMDNDAFASKDDSHYTNGLFYTWMGDDNNTIDFNFMNKLQTNNAISFTHLIFTPKDKRQTTPILDDLPYAGYVKLNFLLYKSSQKYFHEFGINIGAVGPMVKAKEVQSEFHALIGHSKPDG